MSKYIQKNIPLVNDDLFKNKKLGKIKKFVSNYNENIKNTSIKNIRNGITVEFSKAGLKHLLYARNAGYIKLKAVIVLKEMMKYAEYSNFNNPDTDDNLNVLGYFNYKCKVNIEGKIQYFRMVVRLTKDGKFYYDHSFKLQKKPT